MANPNIELLIRVAETLGELRERMVFIGWLCNCIADYRPGSDGSTRNGGCRCNRRHRVVSRVSPSRQDITDDLEAALEQFATIADDLGVGK